MTVNRSEFGSSAPIMVRDQNVSQCQLCSKDFTFTFRRHHCRACGRVRKILLIDVHVEIHVLVHVIVLKLIIVLASCYCQLLKHL